MKQTAFDEYANQYDAWFMKNSNLLYSEVKLVVKALANPGRTLSIGCGSGLFEMILSKECNISIQDGIEPSQAMAEIARLRGLSVAIGTAEDSDYGENIYDTILFNGTPSYIKDLNKSFAKAYTALKSNGRIVVIDVPKEGTYATLYNLAMTLNTWNHELLNDIKPEDPYPIEFVRQASWRTTNEKIKILEQNNFVNLSFFQTLTKHPAYSNVEIEEPQIGFDKGDYVAIIGNKK